MNTVHISGKTKRFLFCSLELRVPFLDHKFTSYFLSIHPEQRQPQYGREKFLIRSAYADTGLLPEEILWRKKEVFSDGVTSRAKPWSEIIQTHVDKHVCSFLSSYNTYSRKVVIGLVFHDLDPKLYLQGQDHRAHIDKIRVRALTPICLVGSG